MHAVYLACLVAGLVATVLFAALGALGGIAGHGAAHLHISHGDVHVAAAHALGHAHVDAAPAAAHGHAIAQAHGSGHAMAHADPVAAGQAPVLPAWLAAAAGWTLSWLSPLVIAAAALWFGGAGLVAEGLLPRSLVAVALLLAVVAALIGATLVRLLMTALVRSSTPPLQSEATGAIGVINAPIRLDAPGEVVYTLEGLHRSAAARSVDGSPLSRGTRVVIVRRERGVAWVTPLDPLEALERRQDPIPTNGRVASTPDRRDLIPPP